MLLLRKCLNDSDDEVRERAFFYLSVLGESDGISDEISTDLNNSAAGNANSEAEIGEIRDFIFDTDQVIDVDALEQFVTEQKDTLVQENENDFNVDISSMLVTEKPRTGTAKSKGQAAG